MANDVTEIKRIRTADGVNHPICDTSKLPIVLLSDSSNISNVTIEKDATYGVAPYNTSYYYTNITVDTDKVGITESDLTSGIIIAVHLVTAVESAYRNVRIRFGSSGNWKPFYYASGILSASSYLPANVYRQFVYSTAIDSSGGFHMIYDSNSTYSTYTLGIGYGTCSTAASTTAKAVVLSSYVLVKGGIVAVKFTYAVPANATMNINSKGAKYIKYNGSNITAGIIKAGDIATFIYDGSYYELLAIDTDISLKETASNKVTSLSSSSTDTQYPSAKCVYDLVGNVETLLAALR